MAELWTFSGINSWESDSYVDRVSDALESRGVEQESRRSYVSRLGTRRPHYKGRNNVRNLSSEGMLDSEARDFIDGGMGEELRIDEGQFENKLIRALFVAPKSDTRPTAAFHCTVYWSPYDKVPNQGIRRPIPNVTFWRNWAKDLREVGGSASVLPVPAKGHSMVSFLQGAQPIVKKKTLPGANVKASKGMAGQKKKWLPTGRTAPDPVTLVREWLADNTCDMVFVGHSQGANIAMFVLNRGLAQLG